MEGRGQNMPTPGVFAAFYLGRSFCKKARLKATLLKQAKKSF